MADSDGEPSEPDAAPRFSKREVHGFSKAIDVGRAACVEVPPLVAFTPRCKALLEAYGAAGNVLREVLLRKAWRSVVMVANLCDEDDPVSLVGAAGDQGWEEAVRAFWAAAATAELRLIAAFEVDDFGTLTLTAFDPLVCCCHVLGVVLGTRESRFHSRAEDTE